MTMPSTGAPALPPPFVAIQAQVRALRGQLEALEAAVEAFAAGYRASVARAQNDASRTERSGPEGMPPVFGAKERAAVAAESVLDRLTIAAPDAAPST